MRIFAAIPVSPAVAERLLALRLRLALPKDGLRWSTPEQWHLTLRFFGDLDEGRLPSLQSALASIAWQPLELRLPQLGTFPAKGMLFAEVEPTPALLHLQASIERQAEMVGSLPVTRPFHPYIALARSRNRTGLRTLEQLANPALPSLGMQMQWTAPELLLYHSELEREGARYQVVGRVSARQV